jgi:prevent-host-death family protein
MKKTITISKASKNLLQIIEDAQKDDNYYVITDKGQAKMVMLSFSDFESWIETLEVAVNYPDLLKDAEELERDIKSGAYKQYVSLEEIIQEQKTKTKGKKRGCK